MRFSDILLPHRIWVPSQTRNVKNIHDALHALASLLAPDCNADEAQVFKVLSDREALQSTGIGDGVAIPHGALAGVQQQTAAMLLCSEGIDFDAIDARPVSIVAAVLGPERATGQHLRMLACIFRLLCDGSLRERLIDSVDGEQAFEILSQHEQQRE